MAVAWEIYQWTGSATALGLVGLINVIPLLALSLPAGLLADQADRRTIIQYAQLALVVVSVGLAALSLGHAHIPDWAPLRWANAGLKQIALLFERHADPELLRFDQPALPLLLALLAVSACVRILGWPARSTIIPLLLPPQALSNAITWNASAFEFATMAGPAIGGFVIAGLGFPVVYLLDAVLGLGFCLILQRVTYFQAPQPAAKARSWSHLLAGGKFIWDKKVILGASSLDLFATLLGGAVALLPLYAGSGTPPCRAHRFGLATCGTKHRRVRHGDVDRPSGTDATPGLGLALVSRRIWCGHHCFRTLHVVLALAGGSTARSVRQRERRGPPVPRPVAHPGLPPRPRHRGQSDLHRLLQ